MRTSKLTPEIRKEIGNNITLGMPLKFAAEAAGISEVYKEKRKRQPQRHYDLKRHASDLLKNSTMNTVKTKDDIKKGIMFEFEAKLDKCLKDMPNNLGIGVIYNFEYINENGEVASLSKIERCSEKAAEWRNAVFQRDEYSCKDCGKKGHIQAHHIKSWAVHPELRYNINNGVTLCLLCHAKRHPRKAKLILNSSKSYTN